MQNEDQHIDLFDRYLRHELNDAELSAFDEKLMNDDAFNAAFIAHKTLVMGIRDYGKTQLKEYLKTHAKHVPRKTFTITRYAYAMAAVLLVFFGVYAVINYYTPNAQKSEISTTEISKKEVPEAEVQNEASAAEGLTESRKYMNVDPQKKEELPPALADLDDAAPLMEENMDRMKDEAATASDDYRKEKETYKILSDEKLSDTILLAVNVTATEIATNRAASKADKDNEMKKSLPANTYGGYNNKVNTIDTVILKNKTAEVSADKYVIEYWQSPINFKGYKMNGKTIQLFGLSGKQLKVINYNSKIYLRNGSTLYIMSQCPAGCIFKAEENQETINLLLNQ